jgi:hypothetical protein
MYRYIIRNIENKLTIFANDFTDIASIIWLWGDKSEWGNINCPTVIQGEAHFISELSKQNVSIKVNNV